jgi:hypothetical protein
LSSGLSHRFGIIVIAVIVHVAWLPCRVFGQAADEVQRAWAYFDSGYGSDYNLLNGRQYILLYSSNSHPFLDSDHIRPGNLLLNGVRYVDLPINYDLYQQQVILQYISHAGEARYLILNRELLDEFTLEGKIFRKISLSGIEQKYAQVIGAGELSFYILWKKSMNYVASMNATPYHYTKQTRQIFLGNSEAFHPIGSRSSFLQLFEEDESDAIRQFLRQERIHFKRASDDQLKRLLEYCTSLEEET